MNCIWLVESKEVDADMIFSGCVWNANANLGNISQLPFVPPYFGLEGCWKGETMRNQWPWTAPSTTSQLLCLITSTHADSPMVKGANSGANRKLWHLNFCWCLCDLGFTLQLSGDVWSTKDKGSFHVNWGKS